MTNRPIPRGLLTVVVSVLAVAIMPAACGSSADLVADPPPTLVAEATAVPSVAAPEAVVTSAALAERPGERRPTTGSVPHQQIGAIQIPEVLAELERRAFLLPGVQNQESSLSLPGARALILPRDMVTRTDVLGGGEFAHIHPDGSLHVWLPVARAQEVDDTKWGELHPWVGRDGFWDGVVMVYTPESLEEVDIVMQLLVDAYNLVTGEALVSSDYR